MTTPLLAFIYLMATAYAELQNVALGKPTAISSNHIYANDSSKAVDGILESTMSRTGESDCFHTGKRRGKREWFMVDLQGTYEILSVKILNRGDCCGFRLSNFKVVVTEQETDHPEASPPNTVCIHRKPRLPQGELTELQCDTIMTGRFVYVVLLSEQYLHFCEIEVMAEAQDETSGQQGCQQTPAEDYFTVGLKYNQTVAFYNVTVTRQPVEPCQVLGSLDDLQNVALHKPVAVSTNYSKGFQTPEKAVDGSLQNTMSSCFHTNSGVYQWFRVDLLAKYMVFYINITNRGDCCGERLSKFKIVVTDEPTDTPELSPSYRTCVYHEDPVSTAATVRLVCRQPLVGRYVTVVLMDYAVLHFCEIQVMSRPAVPCLPSLTSGEEYVQNIALHKPVTISSTDSSGYATPEKAVDGDLRFDMPNCFQTNAGINQWFRITLQEEYTIVSVYITSSDDSLKNFKIVVTLHPPNTPESDANVCASRDEAVPAATTVALKCQKPMTGWYVTLVQLVDQALRFCEIQVMGRPAVPFQPPLSADDLQNVALHKPVAISSNSSLGYNTPEKAVDGYPNNYGLTNCFQTAVRANSWFRVDLQAQHLVFSVKITNRADCCGDRLKNFMVLVTNQPCSRPQSSSLNTTCLLRQEPVAQGATEELKCDRPLVGRYVTVVLLYREALHFCELEVMGRLLQACLPFHTSNNLQNVALFKPAEVSTFFPYGSFKTPEKAVDGSLQNSISDCFHTSTGMHQWFRVDLQTQFVVYSVIITNRGDCCGDRLRNFKIVVTDQPSNSPQDSASNITCQHHEDAVGQGATEEMVCRQPLVGRYVTVVQLHDLALHFCELQVMAKPLAACMPLTASQD